MAQMTGFKVYKGTKDAFISSGKAAANTGAIVFITGGDDSSKSCIFAQGTYFANFSEFLAAINYVKGISVGGQSYNAVAGGGYVAFNASDPTTVKVSAGNNGIEIGLTEAFVQTVNSTVNNLGSAGDTASATGSAFARIANLASIVGKLTGSEGGELESVEGQISSAIGALRTEIVGSLGETDAKTLQAINDELDAIDAKWASYVLKSDLATEVSKSAGSKVNVTVKTKDGKVSDVAVNETQLEAALNLKANAADVYDKTAAESMAQGKVDVLANGAVKANADAIAVLNGNDTKDGSVAKQIKDAINAFAGSADSDNVIENVTELLAYVKGVDGSKNLASAIANIAENTGKINTLNGGATVAGSVAKSVKDAIDSEVERADKAYAAKSTETVASGAATRADEAYNLADSKITSETAAGIASTAISNIAEVSKSNADAAYVEVTVTTKAGSVSEVKVNDSKVKTYADGILASAKEYADTKDGATLTSAKNYANSLFEWEDITQ